jgi:hypothetical protein
MLVAGASISEEAAAIVVLMEAQLLQLQKQFLEEPAYHQHQYKVPDSYCQNSLLANGVKL